MKKFKILFMIAGLLFFAFLIYEVGPASILKNIQQVGWRFVIIFALWFFCYVFQNVAWALEMRKSFAEVGFLSLLKARIAGEAMNGLIPLGNFGGEPVKAYILSNKTSRTEIVASLILDKTVFAFGSLLYIFAGLVVAVFAIAELSYEMKFLVFALLGLMVWGLIWFVRKRTFFTRLCMKLEAWGIATKFFAQKMDHIRAMDERIASFYRSDKIRFVASILFHFLGKMLNAVEFYLVFHYLGLELSFAYALSIHALSVIINTIFIFVPGHWGVAEGGQAFIFLALGLNPADGIAVGVVRRIRHIFWTLIGLAIFAFSDPRKKKEVIEEIKTEEEGVNE